MRVGLYYGSFQQPLAACDQYALVILRKAASVARVIVVVKHFVQMCPIAFAPVPALFPGRQNRCFELCRFGLLRAN